MQTPWLEVTNMETAEIIGWIATSFFIISYFIDINKMKIIQAIAAGIWIVYGVLINAKPVIIANICVLLSSLITYFNIHAAIINKIKK